MTNVTAQEAFKLQALKGITEKMFAVCLTSGVANTHKYKKALKVKRKVVPVLNEVPRH
jgi:hypothetical protein